MATLNYYYPFDSVDGDRAITAAAERRWWNALFTDGVVGSNAFSGYYSSAEDKFKLSNTGVVIIGGAIGVLTTRWNWDLTDWDLDIAAKKYISIRLDTTTSVRSISIAPYDNVETATLDQLDAGGVRDLVLYELTRDESGNVSVSDKRVWANSFDKAIYQTEFNAVMDALSAEASSDLDSMRQAFTAAITEANTELAGLYGSVGRQGFINPTFAVNQRGAEEYTNAGGSIYTVDRWRSDIIGGSTAGDVVSVVTDGNRNALKVAAQPYSGSTYTAYSAICQTIERGVSTFCAGGDAFTVSFDAKADNVASLAVEPVQYARSGSDGATIAAQVVEVTDEWQRFNLTFEGTMTPETGEDLLRIAFVYAFNGMSAYGGTQNATNNFYFANMQINKGAAALPCYVRAYGEELEACQRYFAAFDGVSLSVGATLATTNQAITSPLPLSRRMRKRPTVATVDRAGVAGVATAEAAAGGWRNGLACSVSAESAEHPVFVVHNTDSSALTRVVFSRVTVDAETMD